MAEYIDREQARDAVYARIDELRADKEFNMAKEICIIGVKKYIKAIPTADVVERENIDKAIEEMERYSASFEYADRHDLASAVDYCIGVIQKNIGEIANESSNTW